MTQETGDIEWKLNKNYTRDHSKHVVVIDDRNKLVNLLLRTYYAFTIFINNLVHTQHVSAKASGLFSCTDLCVVCV